MARWRPLVENNQGHPPQPMMPQRTPKLPCRKEHLYANCVLSEGIFLECFELPVLWLY